jgi:Arc/MetJ family transcription regulator
MVRTNVVVNEDLLEKIMRLYGLKTKRAAIDLAIRRLAGEDRYTKMLELEGSGWDGDLDEMHGGKVHEL